MNKIILNYKTTAPECERRGVLVWYVQDQEGLLRSKPNEENRGRWDWGELNPQVEVIRGTLGSGVGGGRAVAGRRAAGADLWCCEKNCDCAAGSLPYEPLCRQPTEPRGGRVLREG